MEFIKYSIEHEAYLRQVISRTAEGEQQLGYPRCNSLADLIAEYSVYPDSSLNESTIVAVEGKKIMGILGYFKDGNYLAIWGPISKDDYSQRLITESLMWLSTNLQKTYDVYVPQNNQIFHAALASINKKYISTQHVMEYCWTNYDDTYSPNGSEFCTIDAETIVDQKELAADFSNLLDVAFNWGGAAKSVIAELVRDKCYFCYTAQQKVTGLLVWSFIKEGQIAIEYLCVDPGSRKQGLATHLISSFIRYVKEVHGEVTIELTHDSRNLIARSLYKRIGFVDQVVYDEYKVIF